MTPSSHRVLMRLLMKPVWSGATQESPVRQRDPAGPASHPSTHHRGLRQNAPTADHPRYSLLSELRVDELNFNARLACSHSSSLLSRTLSAFSCTMVAIPKALLAAAAAQYAGYTGSSGTYSSSSASSGNLSVINGFDWSFGGFPVEAAGLAGCPIDKFVPQFPAGQTQLVAPTKPTKFLGLAFGVQNYTCSSANNYTCVSTTVIRHGRYRS